MLRDFFFNGHFGFNDSNMFKKKKLGQWHVWGRNYSEI